MIKPIIVFVLDIADIMIQFNAVVKQFDEKGEKTGWTYIELSSALSNKLKPGVKKAYRVKGMVDDHAFSGISLYPMGDGNFIMALNASMRKKIKKTVGATVKVKMQVDETVFKPPAELMECLEDEPKALDHFKSLSGSHQRYFANWINSAKSDVTKARRIALTVNAMAKGWNYAEMIRANGKSL